jgi:glyoxylate/hydroxypyruvate/2-ketogluconate reductase
MKEKILITRSIFPDVVEKLEQVFDVDMNRKDKYSTPELIAALQGKAGVLVAMGEKIGAEVVNAVPGLRAVCVSAAGYNNIDVPSLTRKGIIATNAPGPTNETVADFAWGLMIAVARKMVEAEHWLKEGNWKGPSMSRFFGTDVHAKTLGILGMGRIGQAIARRGIGFNMKTFYYNRHRLEEKIEKDCNATYASKIDLLNQADFVVLSLPYSAENHHIIAGDDLRAMKPTSFLINIARGGLIDEPALADALKKGEIAGAGIDVFENEPTIFPGLFDLPNVVLTPHIAGGTQKAQHDLTLVAAENLIAALGYGPNASRPPFILNPEVLTK